MRTSSGNVKRASSPSQVLNKSRSLTGAAPVPAGRDLVWVLFGPPAPEARFGTRWGSPKRRSVFRRSGRAVRRLPPTPPHRSPRNLLKPQRNKTWNVSQLSVHVSLAKVIKTCFRKKPLNASPYQGVRCPKYCTSPNIPFPSFFSSYIVCCSVKLFPVPCSNGFLQLQQFQFRALDSQIHLAVLNTQ